MVDMHQDRNDDQMDTCPSIAIVENDIRAPRAKAVDEKETSSSSSTSSEDINEADFFQLEDPIIGSPILLGAPQEGSNGHTLIEDGTKQNGSLQSGDQMMTSNNLASHMTSSSPIDPKQSPPVQFMSRTSDECPNPNRIPSSVFARSKSTTPMEWSVTSNESLFSINVGNASFSKDHFFLYGKSGELTNLNDPMAPLPPFPRHSPNSSPIASEEVKAIEHANAKVKSGNPKLVGHADLDRDVDESNYSQSLSHRSDGSTTSFAFPILTGDARSSGSLKDNHHELSRQSTAQLPHPKEPQAEKETPEIADEAPKAEAAPPAPTKWFPWCTCPFCC